MDSPLCIHYGKFLKQKERFQRRSLPVPHGHGYYGNAVREWVNLGKTSFPHPTQRGIFKAENRHI